MKTGEDTICAIASPPGNGAISTIRLSGPDVFSICRKVTSKSISGEQANKISLYKIVDGNQLIDEVLISVFQAPCSYTGEDIAEISCHGSVFIQQKIMELLLKNGARLAQPGEFTLRAYLNGKMDLSQAEAVADIIASQSAAAHRLAMNQMRGDFSKELNTLREKLLEFSALIELELDFGEEDVQFANRADLLALLLNLYKTINKLKNSFSVGNAIKNGIPVAIVGKPNVGKSTLLNALLKEERAIVSEIPGTTRDSIEDTLNLGGYTFRFIDTAGIRHTTDTIEGLGIQRTYQKIDTARIVLVLVDADDCLADINKQLLDVKERIDATQQNILLLINKTDRYTANELNQKFGVISFEALEGCGKSMLISAKKGNNLDELVNELVKYIASGVESENDIIVSNARHYEALCKASESLERVKQGIENNLPGDLLAQDIREVIYFIGSITGNISDDEILGFIFSRFCIGK